MKFDNSTLTSLENILRVGLHDEESFKNQNSYLNGNNYTFMKSIHSIHYIKLFFYFGLQWSLKEFLMDFGVLI